MSALGFRLLPVLIIVGAAILAGPDALHAGEVVPLPVPRAPAAIIDAAKSPVRPTRAAIRAIVEQEAFKASLPADIAEAVVRVESGFDPTVIGGVGEIGLMQVRPGTAAMLGFKGSAAELATPEVNIHYGVTYLAKAWRLANGDLCRALMKYRAGHGAEIMSPLSVTYCDRARSHLALLGSPFATMGAIRPVVPASAVPMVALAKAAVSWTPASPKEAYARFRQGTPAASRAYWAAHEARVRAIKARIAAKWNRVALR
ncbi:hypothetical protein BH11PSE4_BH11PSE4_43080 [soil metagenome]